MKNFTEDQIWVSQDANKPGVMIFLDPGHGGIVYGKYTTSGKQYDHVDFQFYEGWFNREVVKLLSTRFKANNITHAFTTISNYDESLSDRIVHISNIMKTYPKYHHVLLSVHGNAAGVESASGVEFFTTPGITGSDYAANLYFPYLYDLGLKMRINRAKPNEYDKESNFFIIRKAEALGCIAMLFELGFYSNREEALKMLDPEFQGTAANALLKGTRDLITKIQTNGSVR